MVRQLRRCDVPGCSDEVTLSAGRQRGGTNQVCAAHHSAEAIALPDGSGHVRFCQACRALHPLHLFPAAGRPINVCLAASKRLAEIEIRGRGRRKARRCQASLREAIASFLGLAQEANHGHRTDAGKDVWASGFFAFASLTGTTHATKAAIVAFYPTAAWLLGWRHAQELVPLTLTCVGTLHMLAPHMHQKYYVKPLREVRAAAAQAGLAVSPSFRFLALNEHLRFQSHAAQQSSWGWSRHGALLLSVLRGSRAAMLATTTASFAFFWLRRNAVVARCRSLQQWLDVVAFTTCSFFSVARYMSQDAGGLPACEKFARLGGVWLVVPHCAEIAVHAYVMDAPLPGLALLELPKTAVLVGMLLASGRWCGGSLGSPWMKGLFSAAMCACSMAFGAMRVNSERRIIMGYIASLPRPAPVVAPPVALDAHPGLLGKRQERQYLHMICKMANASPADLAHDLRDRLLHVLKDEPESLRGVIRPGCVMLALSVRFSSWWELRRGMTSLLTHQWWGETLLDRVQPGIHMNIQRSSYVVRDGALHLQPMATARTPSTVALSPRVLGPGSSTIDVEVKGLGGWGFKVLLRTVSSYIELPVVEAVDLLGGSTSVTVRLPASQRPAGLAWLDVMLDTEDGSLIASNPSPVMLTPLQRVAVQMEQRLAQFVGAPNQFAALFEDMSDCLHGQATASPMLLLTVIELGMSECVPLLATQPALQQADQMGQRLLGAAARSGSLEMMETVIDMLDKHGLPVNPCLHAPDAAGYTALHWAAVMANHAILYSLLTEVDDPPAAWRQCRARKCGKTPAEVMEAAHGPGFVLDEDVLVKLGGGVWLADAEGNDCAPQHLDGDDRGRHGLASRLAGSAAPSAEAQALLGSGVVAALRGWPTLVKISILSVYCSAVLHVGWRDPLIWMALGVAWVALHVVLPHAYSEVYLKGLEEARALAGQQGLAVSRFFSLINAPDEQRAYHSVIAKQGSRFVEPRYSTATVAALMIVCSAGNLSKLPQVWGIVALPFSVAVCALLLGGRAWAVRSGALRLRQWADAGVLLWCFSMQFAHLVFAWMAEDAGVCNLPSLILHSKRAQHLLMPSFLQLSHCLGFTMIIFLILNVPGGLVMPMDFLLPLTGQLVVQPAAVWCMSVTTEIPDPTQFVYINLACNVLHFVMAVTLRLQVTRRTLCTFLRSRAEDCSKPPQ